MKKTPSIFERDWGGNPRLVLDQRNPSCAWVFAGEGVATRKIDGTCCLIRDGRLFKRHEVKAGKVAPTNFEPADPDPETGKVMGWVPVGSGPEDARHREALAAAPALDNGTYELVGPKVQGDPEGMGRHVLVRHGRGVAGPLDGVPTDFEALKSYLAPLDIEGIVWHHPDGRMAKIKKGDLGLPRKLARDAA